MKKRRERASRNGKHCSRYFYCSRSSPFKTPKQVFFNPMHILDTFTTLFLLYIIINFYFFHFNVNFFIRLLKDKTNLTEQRQREKKSENN